MPGMRHENREEIGKVGRGLLGVPPSPSCPSAPNRPALEELSSPSGGIQIQKCYKSFRHSSLIFVQPNSNYISHVNPLVVFSFRLWFF